ncbi:MAG: Cobalamin-independent synthase, Catalytic domain [Candidatus Electronema aureum]|uniref:Cobalamin-independent synthase, Catalytic domain n=1 Tax=Candidatus Electronema aureum TaxID=2005002 RepID=A0A521G398_9BACT|nr:MAG: Cobalamin-independent synthase, Catalytic domain [Candidatus Electronema aureum]
MTNPFLPSALPVLIGSLPLNNHREALELIFAATPEIPLWPQLPGNPLEQMMPQFAEGIPCIREENLASPEGRILFDISSADFEAQQLAFYEDYMTVQEDPAKLADSRFRVSRERAEGLYQFTESLQASRNGNRPAAVKGQVTGPFTMLTGIKDRLGRAGYYDDTVREMVVKGIAMKAAWQTHFLATSGLPVIVFIDEPALAGLGSSAFISVSNAAVQEMINEVAEAIHAAGGLAGIHVCANTEWEILLSSKIDILSFDAYSFFDKLAALTEQVHGYLDRGAILAWGGIPTGNAADIDKESSESLTQLWEKQAKKLVRPSRDLPALLRQMLITPSCGTGSLSRVRAEKVLEMTKAVSANLREKYL